MEEDLIHFFMFLLTVTLAEVLHRLRDKIYTGPEVKITIDPDDLIAYTIRIRGPLMPQS